MTYYVNNGEFGVCSRNLELLEDDENSLWKVAKALNIEEKLRSTGKNIALQGELIGEGIQSNKLKLRGQTVRFFNVFDIDRFEFLYLEDFKEFLAELDLPSVPILNDNYILQNNIDALVKMATIRSSVYPEAWAEGIVIRTCEKTTIGLHHEDFSNGRVSFKAINPEFLLKYGE